MHSFLERILNLFERRSSCSPAVVFTLLPPFLSRIISQPTNYTATYSHKSRNVRSQPHLQKLFRCWCIRETPRRETGGIQAGRTTSRIRIEADPSIILNRAIQLEPLMKLVAQTTDGWNSRVNHKWICCIALHTADCIALILSHLIVHYNLIQSDFRYLIYPISYYI